MPREAALEKAKRQKKKISLNFVKKKKSSRKKGETRLILPTPPYLLDSAPFPRERNQAPQDFMSVPKGSQLEPGLYSDSESHRQARCFPFQQ